MKPAEVLRGAKALIQDPAHWCQFEMCLPEWDGLAKRFCSVGALFEFNPHPRDCVVFLDRAAKELSAGRFSIAGYNDSRTHAEVMLLWDRAIELSEADQGLALGVFFDLDANPMLIR
jgi:hypothetical protein